MRVHTQTLLSVLALFVITGCSQSTGTSDVVNLNVDVDVSGTSTQLAETVFRPGVVGYGLLSTDMPGTPYTGSFFGLNQYLSTTRSRGGYVVIDELSAELRSLTAIEVTDAIAVNNRLDNVEAAIIQATNNGAMVEILLGCTLPSSLSLFDGYTHDVITGENIASEQPIYACAPLKDAASATTWQGIMQIVAQRFLSYGDQVVFVIGNEPETYFAGNSVQLSELFRATAAGLRSGNPGIKIGGITTSSMNVDTLTKAIPLYNGVTDAFTFTEETLPSPLIRFLLQELHNSSIPIEIIQTKKFNGNPSPAASGFWVEETALLESWLLESPQSHNGNVELFYTDFPGWHTVCAEDQFGVQESIWDSEYFPAWYASTYIAMKNYQSGHTGAVSNVEPLLAFLIEYGYPNYFSVSCEPPGHPRYAGFNSSITLNAGVTNIGGLTTQTYIPKPILNALNLLTGLSGSLIPLSSSDDNVHMVAAYDAATNQTNILISYFLPSELNFHPAGYRLGYQPGHLFMNNYGVDYNWELLKQTAVINPTLQSYLDDPEYPKQLVMDMLQGPQTLQISDLGLLPEAENFLTAVQDAGMANRVLKNKEKNVSINLRGLVSGNYLVSRQVVDRDHGNANTHRSAIHANLESVYLTGGTAALETALTGYLTQYGVDSMRLTDQTLAVTADGGSFELALQPNSVHLLTVTGP